MRCTSGWIRWTSLLLLGACGGSGLEEDLRYGGGAARACQVPEPGEEGAFAWTGAEGTREACTRVTHAFGGSKGRLLRFSLARWEGSATLRIRDWNDAIVDEVTGLQAGTSTTIEVPWAGEALLELEPEDGVDEGGPYAFNLHCEWGCEDPWTRHPLFLMHGFGASEETWDEVLTWYGEEGYLARAASVERFEPSPVRAAQWRQALDDWQAGGTWRRVHLIGHSLGGIDARFLAAHLDPNRRVASVTTVASPHWGTPLADIGLGIVNHDYSPEEVGEMMGAVMPDAPIAEDGAPDLSYQGLSSVLWQLSQPGAMAFNETVPDRPDIPYRSWAGMTCGLLDLACQWDWSWELVPLALVPSHRILADIGLPSDGVVDVTSALWTGFEGIVPADHFEIAGQGGWDTFDGRAFFLREAERIAALERGESGPDEPEATPLVELWSKSW